MSIQDPPPGYTGFGDPRLRRWPEQPNEVPADDLMPRPLVAWGVLAATVESLRDSFSEAMNRLSLDALTIDVRDPMIMISYPAIQVTLAGIEVKHTSFHSVDIYPDEYMEDPYRSWVLQSDGAIRLTVVSEALGEILSIQDYITQLYLMSYLLEDTFYYPGTNREYIGIGLQPGILSWSELTTIDFRDQQDVPDMLYQTSCTIKFHAEHHQMFELARISAVDVEALPTLPVEKPEWEQPGPLPPLHAIL